MSCLVGKCVINRKWKELNHILVFFFVFVFTFVMVLLFLVFLVAHPICNQKVLPKIIFCFCFYICFCFLCLYLSFGLVFGSVCLSP